MTEFLLFINKYRDRLVHHAFYRLGDFEEAEDIVQDVFVKIYTQNIFPKLESPEHYLYRMTTNACLDFMRKQKSKLQMQQYFDAKNENSLENDAVRNLNMKEEFMRINNILKTLPEEQAEVVRFRIIDELSFKEITKILGKPESTIKSRFQYAINKLKSYEL
ncbi:MAG: RNA polymerase sigma factor [Bacteroidetes bacterium]|nr:RNA polymerase sigma factor [Bacteroidota bacterium]MCL2302001.1 RNA polymerase sigma factor [Lentimicrobiaceae bacterium]